MKNSLFLGEEPLPSVRGNVPHNILNFIYLFIVCKTIEHFKDIAYKKLELVHQIFELLQWCFKKKCFAPYNLRGVTN